MERQRIHVPFRKVTGKELKKDFFEITEDPLEKTIEQVYVSSSTLASTGFIKIAAYGSDDGRIRFYHGKQKILSFIGRQEIKRNVNPTDSVLGAMLLQLLHYNYQDKYKSKYKMGYEYKVFVFASSKFFGHVYYEDVAKLFDKLVPLFNVIDCSASTAWKNASLREIIYSHLDSIDFHICDITDKFELNNAYREIYKHCL